MFDPFHERRFAKATRGGGALAMRSHGRNRLVFLLSVELRHAIRIPGSQKADIGGILHRHFHRMP